MVDDWVTRCLAVTLASTTPVPIYTLVQQQLGSRLTVLPVLPLITLRRPSEAR
jgi:hypothetical protein